MAFGSFDSGEHGEHDGVSFAKSSFMLAMQDDFFLCNRTLGRSISVELVMEDIYIISGQLWCKSRLARSIAFLGCATNAIWQLTIIALNIQFVSQSCSGLSLSQTTARNNRI